MAIQYNDPINGKNSNIDGAKNESNGNVTGGNKQLNEYYYYRKALIESRDKQFFTPLASSIAMPKHYGKKIKRLQYIPLLDDRNQNDQGIDAAGATIDPGSGNLYGSSHDVGTLSRKMPVLSETGGRVNRVGFTRIQRESTMMDLGTFYEYSQDALDFDTDSELMQHISRELMNGMVRVSEDLLQMDLLGHAGVQIFTGSATGLDDITGEGANPSVVTYEDLSRLDQILTINKCPDQTTMFTGSRNIDTRTIDGGRIMFVGPELVPLLERMTFNYGKSLEEKVFIPVHQYAAGMKPMSGEIGSIGRFRIIRVPNMLFWAGSNTDNIGATSGGGTNYRTTDGRYNVYPMLVIGDDAFNTIGFQSFGTTNKFKIINKKPGPDTAWHNDPYGKMGMTSIQWRYGFLCNRPERIGIIFTVAPI